MFNARSETLAERPAFQRLLASRRCLVIVAGFYEWKKELRSAKQPYYVHFQDDRPLVMAGLYDTWAGKEGTLQTYTILTTDSGPRLNWLHDRMPVLLPTEEAQDRWLNVDSGQAGAWFGLCGPYTGEDLVWHPVTPEMGSPKLQGPNCCAPLKRMTVDHFFGTAKKRRQVVVPKQEKGSEQGDDSPKNARAAEQEAASVEVKIEPALRAVKEEHGTPTPKRKQQGTESSPQPTPDPKQPSLFKFMSLVKKA